MSILLPSLNWVSKLNAMVNVHEFTIAFLVILFVTTGCVDEASNRTKGISTDGALWNFTIADQEIEVTEKSTKSYTVIEHDSEVKSNAFRTFNLATNQAILSDGKTEALKLFDTLVLRNGSHELSLTRYIYGMGKFDGLNIIGVSQSDNRFLYTLNTTSRRGVIDSSFFQMYKTQNYRPELLTLNLPPPPPPPPPSVFSDSSTGVNY